MKIKLFKDQVTITRYDCLPLRSSFGKTAEIPDKLFKKYDKIYEKYLKIQFELEDYYNNLVNS